MITEQTLKEKLLQEFDRRISDPTTSTMDLQLISDALSRMATDANSAFVMKSLLKVFDNKGAGENGDSKDFVELEKKN